MNERACRVRPGSTQHGAASLLGVMLLLALAGALVTAAWESAQLQQRMARDTVTRARLVEVVDNALGARQAMEARQAGREGRCGGAVRLEESAGEGTAAAVRIRVTLTLREESAGGLEADGTDGADGDARAARICVGRRSAWTRLE